jgi:hypothetical protein
MMIDDIRPSKKPTQKQEPVKIQYENFQTPEKVAAEDSILRSATPPTKLTTEDKVDKMDISSKPRPNQSQDKWFSLHWPPGKKEWAIAIVVLLLIGGLGAFLLSGNHKAKTVTIIKHKVVIPPKPTTVPSTLSGLPVNPSINKLPVTGVMIENSTFARPQSGLGQASVVFEAIAEGGITRFLALYQDTSPDNVGPIRSARPYYEQWVLGFDAGYAHVGGSPEALADLNAWGVRDLDQFYNGGSYHRVSTRAAPHNVYTSISSLNQLESNKGFGTSTFTGFARKVAAPSAHPTTTSINLTLSGPDYNVHYDYNAPTNSYNRNEAGVPHVDANTNTQISPKVVIALVMPYSLEADGYHSDYTTIGSGPVYVFQDGLVTTGQWSKSSSTTQFVFTNSTGQPLKLNPGQTWLTALSTSANVTYSH